MKQKLWLVLFLLIIWCGFSNNFQPPNLILGLIFSLLIPYWVVPKPLEFEVNMVQLIFLTVYVIWELLRSSIEVAWDILTPANKSQSKIIELSLQCQHPVQISVLANLISLTPGTLAVDIKNDNTVLVIHIMFAQRQQRIIQFIRNKLEPKVIEVIQYG